jgi:hypothetical protein
MAERTGVLPCASQPNPTALIKFRGTNSYLSSKFSSETEMSCERGHMRKLLILGVALLGSAAPAWAVLGQYESSVASDQQYLRGEIKVETQAAYAVHQITNTAGAVVKEYVSPQGRVFGVSWQGPYVPNLQQLLGSYYTQVDQALRTQTRRRGGPLVVRSGDLVFLSGGHMRAFHGRAYVPSLVPANVNEEVVR